MSTFESGRWKIHFSYVDSIKKSIWNPTLVSTTLELPRKCRCILQKIWPGGAMILWHTWGFLKLFYIILNVSDKTSLYRNQVRLMRSIWEYPYEILQQWHGEWISALIISAQKISFSVLRIAVYFLLQNYVFNLGIDCTLSLYLTQKCTFLFSFNFATVLIGG